MNRIFGTALLNTKTFKCHLKTVLFQQASSKLFHVFKPFHSFRLYLFCVSLSAVLVILKISFMNTFEQHLKHDNSGHLDSGLFLRNGICIL